MTHLIEAHREELDALCRRFHVSRLELFGSAATDRFDAEASDLDFLVDFNRVDSMNLSDQYFGLLEGLKNLFQRDVDLLTPGSLRNPYLIRSVEQTRRLLYAA